MSKSKFNLVDPRTWYLVGAGAVALAAEGTRRVLRRRRRGAAGARATEAPVEVVVTDAAPKAAKPKKAAPKAASQPAATAEAEKKAKAALESVADEAQEAKAKGAKAAKKAKAEVKDAAETAEAKGEQATRKAKAEVKDAAEAVESKATQAADAVKDAAETAEAKGEQVTKKAKAEVKDAAEAVETEVKAMAANGKAALTPDDLTQIKGIGPAFAKRLTEAGYTSYADIANASAEALREATHAPAIANPEEWIDEARAKM